MKKFVALVLCLLTVFTAVCAVAETAIYWKAVIPASSTLGLPLPNHPAKAGTLSGAMALTSLLIAVPLFAS